MRNSSLTLRVVATKGVSTVLTRLSLPFVNSLVFSEVEVECWMQPSHQKLVF